MSSSQISKVGLKQARGLARRPYRRALNLAAAYRAQYDPSIIQRIEGIYEDFIAKEISVFHSPFYVFNVCFLVDSTMTDSAGNWVIRLFVFEQEDPDTKYDTRLGPGRGRSKLEALINFRHELLPDNFPWQHGPEGQVEFDAEEEEEEEGSEEMEEGAA